MKVRVIENTGDFPRAQAEVQAYFINAALDSGDVAPVIDRGGIINWNLFEVIEEEKAEDRLPGNEEEKAEK